MANNERRIVAALAEQLGLPQHEITPEKRLAEDLGADSLDAMEIVMAMEDEFGIHIADERADTWSTVGDIFAFIAAATNAPESGCDYCRNPLFASLKCPGCGRTATNGGAAS